MLGYLFLLAAAGPSLAGFKLTERPEAILRLFREEPHVAVSRAGQVLQFHGSPHSHGCDDGRQWIFFFDTTGRLVSVTRNLEAPAVVSTLLPKHVRALLYQTPGGYPVLRVALGDGREIVAPGARSTGDRVSQVQVVRSRDVDRLYPSLHAER
jgi:hypothetical protein